MYVALCVEDPLTAQRIEEERGLGSWYEYQLEMARRPVLQILEREDATQLRVYEADGPSTRCAEEQAVFHRVVWDTMRGDGIQV
jgi:hypothetical protein